MNECKNCKHFIRDTTIGNHCFVLSDLLDAKGEFITIEREDFGCNRFTDPLEGATIKEYELEKVKFESGFVVLK